MKNFQTLVQTPKLTTSIRENYKGNHSFNYRVGNARGYSNSHHPPNGSAKPLDQINQLTIREKEILQLVAEGKANKEAASELCISIKTVEKHRDSLMEKLGVRGTALLTHFAIAAGIIQCNPWLGGNHAQSREFHLVAR